MTKVVANKKFVNIFIFDFQYKKLVVITNIKAT